MLTVNQAAHLLSNATDVTELLALIAWYTDERHCGPAAREYAEDVPSLVRYLLSSNLTTQRTVVKLRRCIELAVHLVALLSDEERPGFLELWHVIFNQRN